MHVTTISQNFIHLSQVFEEDPFYWLWKNAEEKHFEPGSPACLESKTRSSFSSALAYSSGRVAGMLGSWIAGEGQGAKSFNETVNSCLLELQASAYFEYTCFISITSTNGSDSLDLTKRLR